MYGDCTVIVFMNGIWKFYCVIFSYIIGFLFQKTIVINEKNTLKCTLPNADLKISIYVRVRITIIPGKFKVCIIPKKTYSIVSVYLKKYLINAQSALYYFYIKTNIL